MCPPHALTCPKRAAPKHPPPPIAAHRSQSWKCCGAAAPGVPLCGCLRPLRGIHLCSIAGFGPCERERVGRVGSEATPWDRPRTWIRAQHPHPCFRHCAASATTVQSGQPLISTSLISMAKQPSHPFSSPLTCCIVWVMAQECHYKARQKAPGHGRGVAVWCLPLAPPAQHHIDEESALEKLARCFPVAAGHCSISD